jgi:hypothetical protein
MDFVKLLRSLDDFLYEIMVMLVFYPRTLWLTIRYPQRMMDYADTELGDVLSERYTDTLSPPLFLMASLALTHGLTSAINPDAVAALPVLLRSTENLLLFRVFVFSLFPLLMSLRLLARLGVALDRDTLRPPFYSQCYITAPVAMAGGICLSAARWFGAGSGPLAASVFALVMAWYLHQQASWFASKLELSPVRAWGLAGSTAVAATAIVLSTLVVTAIELSAVRP